MSVLHKAHAIKCCVIPDKEDDGPSMHACLLYITDVCRFGKSKRALPAQPTWGYLRLQGVCWQVATAKGRFIVSHESTVSTKLLSDILSEHFPQYRFPAGEDTPSLRTLDNSKVCPAFLIYSFHCICHGSSQPYGSCLKQTLELFSRV